MKKRIPWNKGKSSSKELREKLSKAHLGHKHSDETKRRMSAAKSGKMPNNFKGYTINVKGYFHTYFPSHPNAVGVYVPTHRLVVEKEIGRILNSNEIVHHVKNIQNNDPSNLMCFINRSAHIRFHRNPASVRPEEIVFDGRKK